MHAPPDEDIDWVVVLRLTDSDLRASAATTAEKLEAARILIERRWPANQVALRLWLRHSVVTEIAAQLKAA